MVEEIPDADHVTRFLRPNEVEERNGVVFVSTSGLGQGLNEPELSVDWTERTTFEAGYGRLPKSGGGHVVFLVGGLRKVGEIVEHAPDKHDGEVVMQREPLPGSILGGSCPRSLRVRARRGGRWRVLLRLEAEVTPSGHRPAFWVAGRRR